MSHMIYMSGNHASMAYQGKVPWHGLGQSMAVDATIEEWIAAAGFDFTIESAVVDYDVDGVCHTMAGRNVLYRSDTNKAISVVSDRYQVVQPETVMEFFRDLCSDMGFALETAGVLKDGGMYWALARTPLNGEINGDTHNGYVLIATSADGSMATHAKLTAIRVVCNNTLSVAMQRESGAAVSVKHSTAFNPEKVKKDLDLVDFEQSWDSFRQTMTQLGEIKVSDETAKSYFADLLRPATHRAKPRQKHQASNFAGLINAPAGFGHHKIETDKESPERAIRGFETLWDAYQTAPGAVPGTAYGLVQGVTRYLDHDRGKDDAKRLQSAWFGQGDSLKQQAVERAVALTTQ